MLTKSNKMSLNSIQITPYNLADMYADVLVENVTNTVPDTPKSRHLGDNRQNITVIVNHESVPFLPDKELSFLSSILNACKLSLADIAIINFHNTDENKWEETLDHLSPKHVLLFGVTPLSIGLPIHFPQFQLQPFNKRTYLYGPTLSELENEKNLKQKLWMNLKTMFGL